MSTPPEPDDALLRTFMEEAKELPQAAAAEARSRQRRRTRNFCALTVTALFLTAGISIFKHAPRREPEKGIVDIGDSSEAARPPAHKSYVKVYQAGETAEANFIPPDATEREKQLLTELPGIPFLIVKTKTGQVTGVHIFER
jgi:hypothetical protein